MSLVLPFFAQRKISKNKLSYGGAQFYYYIISLNNDFCARKAASAGAVKYINPGFLKSSWKRKKAK